MSFNNPIQTVKNFFISIFEGEKVEDSDKVDNSKTEKIDNLQVKINNNYEPENRELPEVVLDRSAENNAMLPNDVLKVAFSHLRFTDLVSTSMTSKHWEKELIETAKSQEAVLLKSFLSLVAEKLDEKDPSVKEQLLPVAEKIDFSEAKNLSDLKNMLLAVRLRTIQILSNSEKLRSSFFKDTLPLALIKKPKLFDGLFLLVSEYIAFKSEMDKPKGSPHICVKEFCELDALDVALNCLEIIWDEEEKEANKDDEMYRLYSDMFRFLPPPKNYTNYCSALKHIAKPLLKNGNFKKVVELANKEIDESTKKEIVEMCMGLGKIDEGYALAKELSVQVIEDYQSLKSIMQKIKESKFKEAVELQNSMSPGMIKLADHLIAEGLNQACDELIQEAKFDEVKRLVAVPGMKQDHIDNVYRKLAIAFIKWNRFDEAVEYTKLMSTFGRYSVIMAFCEKDRFDEAELINQDNILASLISESINIYKSICFESLNGTISKIKNVIADDEANIYLIRKLLDANQVDKAIEVAGSIFSSKKQIAVIKMLLKYSSVK